MKPSFPNQPPRYVGPRRTDRRRLRGIERLRDLIDRVTAERAKASDDELDAAFIAAMADDDEEGKP